MSKIIVRVVVRVVSRPDKVEEVKAVLLGILEPTRQEAGCIVYELLQNHDDPTDFTFVEEWENQALLDAHLTSAHLERADAQLQGLVAAEPDIRFYQLLA